MKVVRGNQEITVQLTLLPGDGTDEIAHALPEGHPVREQNGTPAGNRE
jgi:hypothetical protein